MIARPPRTSRRGTPSASFITGVHWSSYTEGHQQITESILRARVDICYVVDHVLYLLPSETLVVISMQGLIVSWIGKRLEPPTPLGNVVPMDIKTSPLDALPYHICELWKDASPSLHMSQWHYYCTSMWILQRVEAGRHGRIRSNVQRG
jgi:hypothetical protein